MASQKIPVTFTFHKDGTKPPVFIAGSFSEPSWQPQEMDASMNEHGEYSFTKDVEVGDTSEIQYKFRIGLGDWWTTDATTDTVTDAQGNVNNVLKPSLIKPVPEIVPVEAPQVSAPEEPASPSGVETPEIADTTAKVAETTPEVAETTTQAAETTVEVAETAAEVAESAMLLDPATPEPTIPDEKAGSAETPLLSSTPIPEGAPTAEEAAEEVAEDAAKLDTDNSEVAVTDNVDDGPLFSHEYLGGPTINIETPSTKEPGHHEPTEEATDKPSQYPDESEIDFDDPQLEHFPSENRDSIMAAVRRLSTTIDADRMVADGVPLSPVVSTSQQEAQNAAPQISSAPSTEDQSTHTEDDQGSSELVQTAEDAEDVEAEASLQSIAEDEEALNEAAGRNGIPAQLIQHSGPASKSEALPEPIGSDDDEGIAMYNPSYQNSVKDHKYDSSCQASDCQASDTHDSRADESETEQSALDDSVMEPEDKIEAAHDDISPKPTPADSDARTANITTAAPIEPVISEGASLGAGSTEASEARSISLEAGGEASLQKQTNDERPSSSSSARSLDNVKKDGKWLKAFLHTILVDWIGGLLLLLCGRNNKALSVLGTGALFFVGLGVLGGLAGIGFSRSIRLLYGQTGDKS